MFVSLMPTVVGVLQPGSVVLSVLNVRSAGIMEMRRVTLYPKAAFSHPDFKRISDNNFERMKVIMVQDQTTQATVHQAYKSRYAPRGKLASLEAAIPQLNQWSLERYRRGLADLAAVPSGRRNGTPRRSDEARAVRRRLSGCRRQTGADVNTDVRPRDPVRQACPHERS